MAKQQITWQTAVDKYTLGATIGAGGSGVVYEAIDSAGEVRAIKALDPSKATSSKRKRFQNELQFCMATRHQNVIRVLDYGVNAEGVPFFVMQRFPLTLRQQLERLTHPDELLKLFGSILDGVEAAHLLGVWHRDLKPENILVDRSGVPVVCDFGIAHFEQDELYTAVETKDNERLANFQYAAPEQRVRSRAVDLRADVYALGLILNELFTRELAVGSKPKQIASVSRDHGYLDDIVDEMIRQNPEERPESIDRVKQLFIARRQYFVSRQRLDTLSRSVVDISKVSDPIVAEPVRIVSTDFLAGELIFLLNHKVPSHWTNALHSVGGPYTYGQEPAMVRVSGDTARIHVSSGREAQVKAFVEQWISQANIAYAERVKAERRRQEAAERSRLEAERREEEYRAEVLRKLNP